MKLYVCTCWCAVNVIRLSVVARARARRGSRLYYGCAGCPGESRDGTCVALVESSGRLLYELLVGRCVEWILMTLSRPSPIPLCSLGRETIVNTCVNIGSLRYVGRSPMRDLTSQEQDLVTKTH